MLYNDVWVWYEDYEWLKYTELSVTIELDPPFLKLNKIWLTYWITPPHIRLDSEWRQEANVWWSKAVKKIRVGRSLSCMNGYRSKISHQTNGATKFVRLVYDIHFFVNLGNRDTLYQAIHLYMDAELIFRPQMAIKRWHLGPEFWPFGTRIHENSRFKASLVTCRAFQAVLPLQGLET